MTRSQLSLVGKKIKKKLIDKNLTLQELAERVGTTPQYINHIMYGRRPGDKYLDRIYEVLEIRNEKKIF